jgi:hypothetical protein
VTPLDALEAARRVTGVERLAVLRDAAEGVAEWIRPLHVRSVETIPIDRMIVETRVVLPDARLVSPFAILARRALSIVASDGTRVLVDPSDAGDGTPYEERIFSRHPVLARVFATNGQPRDWRAPDVVFSTSLALRTIDETRVELRAARWLVTSAELEAARHPSPRDVPRYARTPHTLETVSGAIELAAGVVAIPTPGTTAGHASVVFSVRGKIHVITDSGVAVDAWSPYESKIPGLREAVRLRNVEAVVRGDATDPSLALESMAIERALADRDERAPAFFHVVPAMALTPAMIAPRLRPFALSPFA